MICLSIQNKTYEQIEALLERVEMAEIRLDRCELTTEQIESLFSSDTPLIATCRTPEGENYREAERKLLTAIKAGARYADLEIEAPKPVSKRIAAACDEWGTVLIRSYHDFSGTPDIDNLRQIADRCRHHDGQVVKIVTTATSEADNETILSLYKYYTAESLVAFAMGETGTPTRLGCLKLGAPYSYACEGEGDCTAAGQISYETMYKAVYGERRPLGCGGTTSCQADGAADATPGTAEPRPIRMPASKSYAQRAIVAAALADGTSTLEGYTPCSDSEAALALVQTLGAKVERQANDTGVTTLKITGIGATLQSMDSATLHVGESGLLTRLMLPLSCQLFRDGATITGEGTLSTRPLTGADAAIAAMGGVLSSGDADAAAIAPEAGCAAGVPSPATSPTTSPTTSPAASHPALTVPLTVRGPLKAGRIQVDGSKTSQIVSGALMALALGEKNSSLSVLNPTSIPYIYMTMDILRKFGVKVRSEMYGGRQLLDQDWDKCTEILLKVKENQKYTPAEMTIEGDWSAAAVFLAAGAIFGAVSLDGLDTSSLQADLSMMDLLMNAGASLSQLDEPHGTIVVKKSPLQGFQADLSNCPDLFPVAAVLCAFCQGKSTLGGVHRLSHKESDRGAAITAMLLQMGVPVQIKGDNMVITGESLASRLLNGRQLHGGKFTSSHDHRMVMALRLAELGADSPITIDDTQCVAKSFPDFNDIWGQYVRK